MDYDNVSQKVKMQLNFHRKLPGNNNIAILDDKQRFLKNTIQKVKHHKVIWKTMRVFTVYASGRQPFSNAAQITLSMTVEGPLHLKPRKRIYNSTTNYKMKNGGCVVLKAEKMQSACFFFLTPSHR